MGSMIKEAVESVWASERKPDEILLIDDGSCGEKTLLNIRELESNASERSLPLRVIRQRNQGLAASRNIGLEAANGEFISFLDGDDMIEPSFYRIALQILEKYPRLGGVAAWAV
jgi:glycosyltransferase involved in cell wall biosynthesis